MGFLESFWKNIERNDSGFLRLLVTIGFILFALFGTWLAYLLVLKGVNGEFKIVSEFKGWTLYITSLSPALAFLLLVGFAFWMLPKAIKALTPTS